MTGVPTPPVRREQLIAALVPETVLPQPGPPPLPVLPTPAPAPVNPQLLAFARPDRSGRLAARELIHALGWQAGDRLGIDTRDGDIVVRRDPGGCHLLGPRGQTHHDRRPGHRRAARTLLQQLGITPADLNAADLTDPHPPTSPTVLEYVTRARTAAGPGARRTYGTYWNRMATRWPDRALTNLTATDIEQLKHEATATARSRRSSRHGRQAGEHVVAAARALFNLAIADGILDRTESPAHRVAKPRRLPNTRRALTADELREINLVARTTGNDVILDALLLRLHTETACRRGGALALRLADLDAHRGLIRLAEKGGTVRWQPISLHLATALTDHAAARGAVLPTDSLLHYRDGRALTSRRHDQLWHRIGQHLPWAAAQGISTHWLRHTTLTWVERHFGYGIARAYAGHTDSTGPATTTYIKADLHAVATALQAMTGQPHPLALNTSTPAALTGLGLRLASPDLSAVPSLRLDRRGLPPARAGLGSSDIGPWRPT